MKTFSKFLYFIILAFGFFLGRFSVNHLSKKKTETEIVKTVEQKQEVSTQATTQKVSTLSQQTAYTEKFYSPKGILTHEIVKSTVSGASTNQDSTIELKQTSEMTSASIEKVTTIETFQSNWKGGITFPATYIYKPQNFVSNPQNIYGVVGYRLFRNFEVLGMVNYKFQTQISFMIGL